MSVLVVGLLVTSVVRGRPASVATGIVIAVGLLSRRARAWERPHRLELLVGCMTVYGLVTGIALGALWFARDTTWSSTAFISGVMLATAWLDWRAPAPAAPRRREEVAVPGS